MQMPSDVRSYQARANRFTGERGPWLEHLVEELGHTFEEATQMLARWELIPYVDNARGHMATLLKDKKEVHFAVYRCFRKKGHINTATLSEFLQPILDKESFLVTKVADDESSAFIERLGFEELGSTIDGVRTFILNEIKYPKASPCKQ